MIALGIDPGLDGAVARLVDGQVDAVVDIPTIALTVNGRSKRIVDVASLHRILGPMQDADICIIEEVHAMPAQGVTSAFTFGRTLGQIDATVRCLHIPLAWAAPSKWKRDFGLSANKDETRLRASELLPDGAEHWGRKKDHNRAEACLLALYGQRTIRGVRP